MVVIDSIDEGLALTIRVEVPSNFFEDSSVKIFRNNLAVEAVDFKLHIIFQFGTVEYLTGNRVVNGKLFAFPVVDTFHTQFGADIVGRIMVDQITVNDRFTVGIVKDGIAKYLRGMKCRGCGQGNLHCIEIFDDGAVFADIVILVTIEHFRFAHFFVQNVATVCFVDHDQIVVRYRGHGIAFGIENPFDQALYCGNMYLGFLINFLFIQALDVIDGIQGHQFFDFDFFENILGLFAKRSAIHEEQDTLKAIALNKAVNHTKNSTGLAGTSRHGKQNSLFAVNDSLLRCFDSADLILA